MSSTPAHSRSRARGVVEACAARSSTTHDRHTHTEDLPTVHGCGESQRRFGPVPALMRASPTPGDGVRAWVVYLQDCNGVDRRFAGRALAACTGASHLGQHAEGAELIPKVDMRRATNNLKCVAHRMLRRACRMVHAVCRISRRRMHAALFTAQRP